MQETNPQLAPFGLDPNGFLYFCIAFVTASIIVVVSRYQEFDERTLPKSDDDYITQLLPRDLASPREYALGLFIYLVLLVSVLAALSVLGPPVLKLFGIEAPAALGATPIAVALAIIGLMPNVPGLREIEISIRRFAHRRAFIPAAARATAERLTTSRFDFSQYQDAEILGKDEMRGVKGSDFEAPRGSIEHNWAKLCSLCYGLRLRQEQDTQILDRRLLDSYRSDLNSVYERRESLEAQLAHFRNHPDDSDFRSDLREKIRRALQKLYVFIGCATRLRGGQPSEMDQRLKAFGFDLDQVKAPPTRSNLIIVGLAYMAGAVLVICYVAAELAKSRLWSPSPYFPTSAYDPFIWAWTAALAHGAAIFTADKIRSRLMKKERWYEVGTADPKSMANYIRVAVACALVGYIVLLACGAALQTPFTWAMAKGAAPYALMPAVTGAFYAAHLDDAELGRRPSSRLREIAPQAVITGLMGFAASDAWISLGNTNWPTGIDLVILVSLMGAAVGATLAWYIPKNAASRGYDPLFDAKESRAREIRALALQRFNDAVAAERWLTSKTASLQGQTPAGALKDARNYDDVLRLLSKVATNQAPVGQQQAN